MAAKPRGLGKGLDSLIPSNTTVNSKAASKPEEKVEKPDTFVDINLIKQKGITNITKEDVENAKLNKKVIKFVCESRISIFCTKSGQT